MRTKKRHSLFAVPAAKRSTSIESQHAMESQHGSLDQISGAGESETGTPSIVCPGEQLMSSSDYSLLELPQDSRDSSC